MTRPHKPQVCVVTKMSHNTMSAFFSGVDDSTELGDPGMHVVVGDIDINKMQYDLKASVTAHRRRYLIDYKKVIDTTPLTTDFHKSVLDIVAEVSLRPYSYPEPKGLSPWLPKQKPSRMWNEQDQAWEDWCSTKARGGADPADVGADLMNAHELCNELYDQLMGIQDGHCHTADDLATFYHEVEATIERLRDLLDPIKPKVDLSPGNPAASAVKWLTPLGPEAAGP